MFEKIQNVLRVAGYLCLVYDIYRHDHFQLKLVVRSDEHLGLTVFHIGHHF